ncbi:nucleic acid/nucleotide deaminase domain-containing protein [Actinacidiphila oryziradicis]|uniref:nucleic acid/nucleotide deaminase domain-containing protein n=1 Tax=Actinacidiphila oryziradicis TaxID=2571141 RepID=UPI00145CA9CE|nr:nucleic acid/nucleotide deaminase domain-containing protein [Actinacidiphila oryziradicis]
MTDDGTLRIFGPVGPDEPAGAPAHRLTGLRVPAGVGPYFTTSDRDPVPLGEYAAATGHRVAREECADWARLGGDNGFELCADAEGTVRAVLLDYDENDRFVNSSPEAFASGLGELREALRVILGTDRPSTATAAFDRLTERLRALDPRAFAERENWWPLVLDDIRDTASVENFAAFEHLDPEDGKRIVTQAGAIAQHPEERLWTTLNAAGVEPGQVLRVHTDLQACFMPGHYCSLWLAQLFPHAEMTHSFPYGETADSRAEGIRRLREATDDPAAGA